MLTMNRQEIRLQRIRELVTAEGGLARFAEKVGMSNSQASQIAGKKPIRNIGNTVAARIEEAFGKPTGWLDAEPDQQENLAADVVAEEDGTLRLMQLKEASRILELLEDAEMSTALGLLQDLYRRAQPAPVLPSPEMPGSPPNDVAFSVGRRSTPAKRHDTK